ncbi:Cenp-O kinetochore centromere component-domain-containing protein [Aspergillus floccosus]
MDDLDSDIASIRREIRTLNRRRRFLTSSLLSSSKFQKRLQSHQSISALSVSSLNDDVSPLAQSAGKHAHLNHHRVAFSATTFPFKDPAPNSPHPNLLGVRIDICARNGRYTKPYYILLRRRAEKTFQVHRHTIPAFISMERLERLFLPVSRHVDGDGEEAVLKPWKTAQRRQDLQGLVRELRRQLVAWHLRVDAVNYLRETLGVVQRSVGDYDDEGVWERDVFCQDGPGVETRLETNDLGIVSLAATALDATYVRLEWADGRVGRFKISAAGAVERAVVIGDSGRDKVFESVLTGGDGRVETVLDRLRRLAALSASGDT